MIPLGPVTSAFFDNAESIYGAGLYGVSFYGSGIGSGTTYTAAQVQALLFGPSLQVRWYFDLLGPTLTYKADLTSLVMWDQPPTLNYTSTQAVKRNLAFTMRASSTINPLRDLIRIRFQIRAPDGGWLQWVIGLFLFVPPTKEIHEGFTWWQVTAPDLNQLLADATFTAAYSVPAGMSYPAAIRQIVTGYGGPTPLQTSIPDPVVPLPIARVWDAGASRLTAVNDLLTTINYAGAWMKGTTLSSQSMPDFETIQPNLTLDTVAGQAQIIGPLKETPDYSNAYNQITIIGQDPTRTPITAYYENRRANSLISLLNWHPRGKMINDSAIASQGHAQARARTEAQTGARIFSTLTAGMVPFPFFEDLDIVNLTYNSSDEGLVRYNYLVVLSNHACVAGTPTQVGLQRLVNA